MMRVLSSELDLGTKTVVVPFFEAGVREMSILLMAAVWFVEGRCPSYLEMMDAIGHEGRRYPGEGG